MKPWYKGSRSSQWSRRGRVSHQQVDEMSAALKDLGLDDHVQVAEVDT